MRRDFKRTRLRGKWVLYRTPMDVVAASSCFGPRHPADVKATWADINRARQLLSWAPRVSIEDGLRRTVEWYMKHRHWARSIDVGTV